MVQLAQAHQNSGVSKALYAGGAHQDDLKLTTHGRQLAGHLLDNYFVLDVSFMGKASALELVQMARLRNRPVLATRTYARSLAENVGENQCETPHSHGHSDAILCAIAETGGVIGIAPHPTSTRNGRCMERQVSENDYIAHIDYVAKGLRCQNRFGQRIDMMNHIGVSTDGPLSGLLRG